MTDDSARCDDHSVFGHSSRWLVIKESGQNLWFVYPPGSNQAIGAFPAWSVALAAIPETPHNDDGV